VSHAEGRARVASCGSLHAALGEMRSRRPLDLSAARWRGSSGGGSFAAWQTAARRCLREGLHYEPADSDLRPVVSGSIDHEDLVIEAVEFNTTAWFRPRGYFLYPKKGRAPFPGMVVCHAWGGPMCFGKERIVPTGRDHPVLRRHRATYYSGRYLAEEVARRGYAVLVIDAYHFGERAPYGLGAIPRDIDPFALAEPEVDALQQQLEQALYLGVRQLNWAGATWAGVNFHDDSRCIDYLLTRPEVDPERIGCAGLSGGAWRTNILAALDSRIKASVSVGWMTTGDAQFGHDVEGVVGTFCLLPGVWDRMDIPDLSILAAPNPVMVVSCVQDELFPPDGQREADRQIREGFLWAGCPGKFHSFLPPKPHCFDADIQREALDWLDANL
jgi:dienelactone hydrolase